MSKGWSRNRTLDAGTFGGSNACHILVDMINKDVIPIGEKHKVLFFIQRANYQFKWLATLQEPTVRERAFFLMKEDLLKRIDAMTYPEKFRSILRNVIVYHHNRYLEKSKR